jgi:hypothetical protein
LRQQSVPRSALDAVPCRTLRTKLRNDFPPQTRTIIASEILGFRRTAAAICCLNNLSAACFNASFNASAIKGSYPSVARHHHPA